MSKTGEIYQLNALSPKRYFQYVAKDETALHGDVIAVLNHRGDVSPKPSDEEIQELVNSGTEFFTHTTIEIGVKQGHWSKLGNSKPVDFSKALFKQAFYKDHLPDIEPSDADHYHSWVIWGVGEEWEHIGAEIEKYPQAERGAVFAPQSIVYRIENGKYPGDPYYGQER